MTGDVAVTAMPRTAAKQQVSTWFSKGKLMTTGGNEI